MSQKSSKGVVNVFIEQRFYRVDNQIYTKNSFAYSFWLRYLEEFNHVVIIARVLDVNEIDVDFKKVNGEGVSFIDLPHYQGYIDFFSCFIFI